MKHLFTILILAIAGSTYSLTYTGDLILTTQAEVNAFNYDVVTGTLTITGSGIVNINSLSTLDTVGSIHIQNTNITNVNGLNSLKLMTGTPNISELFFDSDSLLNDLSGFTNTKFTNTMSLSFNACVALTNLNGLQDLDWTTGNKIVSITNCSALISLNGLILPQTTSYNIINSLTINTNTVLSDVSALTGFSVGTLEIDYNDSLKGIDLSMAPSTKMYNNVKLISNNRLKKVKFANNASPDIYITSNPVLDTISGMNAHSGNLNNIYIVGNSALSSIDIFNFTTPPVSAQINYSVTVCFNPKITNVNFLRLITSMSSLTITSDPLLTNCCGIYSLLSSNGVTGSISISDNPFACDNQSSILANCASINAGADVSICPHDSVTLTARGASSYIWNTGDTIASIRVSPSVTSTYIVTGLVNSVMQKDTVVVNLVSKPVANYTAPVVCAGLPDTFINTSTNATSYQWITNNIILSTDTDLKTTFNTVGTVDLKLIASNAGCKDSIEKILGVFQGPTPDFSMQPNPVCAGCEVIFLNNSMNANTYSWNFGDGQTSNQGGPFHTYTTQGLYTVTLTAIGVCKKSKSDTIRVTPVTAVKNNISFLDKIEIFPNPARDVVMLGIHSKRLTSFSIALITIDGRMVWNKELIAVSVINEKIDLSDLSSGTYILKIKAENEQAAYEIIKK